MTKRILLICAMAGIYIWIRRLQTAAPVAGPSASHKAEAEWASEGGANPAASV